MKTQKGIREHDADELRKAKRLEPIRKSGKERHSLYSTLDEDDDEAPEETDDGPAQYEVTCPACGATSIVEEDALLDGDPVCPNCGKPLDFEVTEE